MKRIVAAVLIATTLTTPVFAGELNLTLTEQSRSVEKLLAQERHPQLLAADTTVALTPVTAADQTNACRPDSSSQQQPSGFWDVHFGGYRWMWWAAAAAALIAIHADAGD